MSERDGGGSGTSSIAPLYQRLPKGPHRLAPEEVSRHQRIRMHGAMVEAVAEQGYERTSVKQVVGLAGVSRRAFYEQFANKEECFLATFDLIAARCVRRISDAYRSSEGDFEDRMLNAFVAFVDELVTNPKEAQLMVINTQAVGATGMLRLRRTCSAFEHLLSNNFLHTQGVNQLPRPVVRAIVGGLRRVVFLRLRDGRADELRTMAEEMLQWSLLFQTPAISDLDAGTAAAELLSTTPARPSANAHDPRDDRTRIMGSVLELAISEHYEELSAPRIADGANVPVEIFFELFEDREECFLAAFDMLSEDLLGVISNPELTSPDWTRFVHNAVDALLHCLAANPTYAETIAMSAAAPGDRAIERNAALTQQITALLTADAPPKANSQFAVEGIAGAIWYTIHCHVASRQTRLLPTLSDHLTFVVLAPFLGAEEAARTVTAAPACLNPPV